LQNNELASVYLDSRYPGDMGLLPNGKPTIGEAKEFYCFALYIYDRICNILKIDKSELI